MESVKKIFERGYNHNDNAIRLREMNDRLRPSKRHEATRYNRVEARVEGEEEKRVRARGEKTWKPHRVRLSYPGPSFRSPTAGHLAVVSFQSPLISPSMPTISLIEL